MPPKIIKNIELLFKKALHLPFYLLLRKGDSSRIPLDPGNVKSILILRPDKLGDMIATVPVIHALKKKYPYMRVEVMASPWNKSMVENDPGIDKMHLYTKNIFKDFGTILRLRRFGFDVIYDPICHDSTTGLLLTKIIGRKAAHIAARKLTLHKYYDYCREYEPDGHDHNFDNGLLIFDAMGVDPKTVDPYLPVYLPAKSKAIADRFYAGLPDDSHLKIGLNISAGSPSRALTVEKYAGIVNNLSQKHGNFRFIIFCIMSQRAEARRLIDLCRADIHLIPENLSLLDVGAIMNRLDMLITPDTSMVHIARLMKIPVVGMYSGHLRNFRFWRPYGQKHGAVLAKNKLNLHDIEAEQVVEEFDKLFNDIRQGTPADAGKN